MDLAQAVDRFAQQLRAGVLIAVPLLVGGGVAQAELGADVDQLQPSGEQFGHHLGDIGALLGQHHRPGATGAQGLDGIRRQHQVAGVGERGYRVGETLAVQAVGSGMDHAETRMVEQQAQGAFAGVAGGTKDGDGDLLAHGRGSVSWPDAGTRGGRW